MSATATITRPPTTAVTHVPITHVQSQCMLALGRANEIRVARAELKRRVAFGEIEVADVILQCPSEAHGMAVADLLCSQRRWGQIRCRKLLDALPLSEKLPMSETKTVGSLTDRQRQALATMLSSPEYRRLT